ncbi:hypothetical protein ACFYV5_06455 [Streptomyces sp. NPDC003035]|uniref:hypothetical protein n=1 Tax=Streptomyces sp. NPDC003035 TaxID=3364676 RepID=UPI00367AD2D5
MGRTGTLGRRALLTAGAVTLAGCTSDGGGGGRPRKQTAAERAALAEAALRRRSAAQGRTLLERYDAVLAAHPSLAARLSPLRRAAAAHAAALAEGLAPSASPSARTATNAAPSAGTRSADGVTPSASAPVPAPVSVSADPAAALTELAATVRRTADAHTATLLDAPPEYARLLASVAAAGAAHAYLLTEGGPA